MKSSGLFKNIYLVEQKMSMIPISPGEPRQAKSGLWIVLASILVLCLCATALAGLGGFSAWEMKRTQDLAATAATQTMQAQATATHVAGATERAGYEFIDRFNDNSNDWFTEYFDDESLTAQIKVINGVYNWNIDKVKIGFARWGSKSAGKLYLTDFDIYVDARLNKNSADKLCYGLRFRGKSYAEAYSYYAFFVCNEQAFQIAYFDGGLESWITLHEFTQSDAIHAYDWNSLGVSARDDHLTFKINDWTVAELDDHRSTSGEVGVFLVAFEGQSGSVAFDNFAIQTR